MSINFKSSRGFNGKKSRRSKKFGRTYIGRSEATHMAMRRGDPRRETLFSHYSYGANYRAVNKWLRKFIGKPVDMAFKEFTSYYNQYKHNVSSIGDFYEHIDKKEEVLKWGGYYVTNGILNYKEYPIKNPPYTAKHIKYNKEQYPTNDEMSAIISNLDKVPMPLIGKLFVVVNKNLLYLDVYLISKSRYESLSNPSHITYGYYGKSTVEYIKEFTTVKVVGYGRTYRVLTYQYERTNLRMYDYYYYLVKIRDIEEYKKEKFKP